MHGPMAAAVSQQLVYGHFVYDNIIGLQTFSLAGLKSFIKVWLRFFIVTAISVGNSAESGFDGLAHVLQQPDLHSDWKVSRSGRCIEALHETNNGNHPIPQERNETGTTSELDYDLHGP